VESCKFFITPLLLTPGSIENEKTG